MTQPALIFDFDGLLVDTESTALRAWKEEFAVHGVAFPLDVWHRFIGSQGSQLAMIAALRAGGVGLDEAKLIARLRARHTVIVSQEFMREGVEEFLDGAAAAGAQLAVASSASRDWLDEHLERLGIRDRFAVVCARDNGRVKPAPDIYLAALAGLGAEADDAIAFEDSPNGIAAAKAAGLYCVAVPNPVTIDLGLGAADLVVDSFADITVAGLLARRRTGSSAPVIGTA
jgi:HAD superfamily hydrolase (TIGR01509 family)